MCVGAGVLPLVLARVVGGLRPAGIKGSRSPQIKALAKSFPPCSSSPLSPWPLREYAVDGDPGDPTAQCGLRRASYSQASYLCLAGGLFSFAPLYYSVICSRFCFVPLPTALCYGKFLHKTPGGDNGAGA